MITITSEQFQKMTGHAPEGDDLDGRRIHHYDRVRVGSHQESYQVSEICGQDCRSVSVPRHCSSNSNGTASCTGGGTRTECSTKYCSRTKYRTVDDYENQVRYRDWYSWMAWRWVYDRTLVNSGLNLDPKPPIVPTILAESVSPIPVEKERFMAVQYKYICQLKDSEPKTYNIDMDSLGQFNQCKSGRQAELKIVVGMVSIEKWR